MEVFRIITLHLAVFAAVLGLLMFSRLAGCAVRAIRLTLECRQLNTSKRKPPVFTGVHPVLLRMEQGVAGNLSNGDSQ